MEEIGEIIKWFFIVCVVGILLMIIAIPFGILGRGCGLVHSAVNTVANEIDPAYLLKKYEWFKDCSAALDKKIADISVFQKRIDSIREDYKGVARKDWPRDERESLSLRESEVAGIKASFNQLASEYNAQMAKINWRFTNIGQLPQGATQPLPKEYKPYEDA